ncbi:hypothetical protein BD311DRAFT_768147 [Dichomitus squalens]|uniref:Uncharacterized protein n=1 Tax=Dichomitus squalens TaxID=114155 RepID=A0A4Q9MD08_9APHY|nr:hypothetical protein BD311DRAFT_768147 [Dichomitus squalens]
MISLSLADAIVLSYLILLALALFPNRKHDHVFGWKLLQDEEHAYKHKAWTMPPEGVRLLLVRGHTIGLLSKTQSEMNLISLQISTRQRY